MNFIAQIKRKVRDNWNSVPDKFKKILKSVFVVFVIGGFITAYNTLVTKKTEDLRKSPEEIIREQGFSLDINGFYQAWGQRNREIIEKFIQLKKDNPERYIDIKLNPKVFTGLIIKDDNLPFLKKNKDLLIEGEACEKINGLDSILNSSGFYYGFGNKEKQEFIQEVCKENFKLYQDFVRGIEHKKIENEREFENLKKAILSNELSFLPENQSDNIFNDLVENCIYGKYPSGALEAPIDTVPAIQCGVELEHRYSQFTQDEIQKIRNFLEKYQKHDEFMEVIRNRYKLDILIKDSQKKRELKENK